jgi:hypothetical protein
MDLMNATSNSDAMRILRARRAPSTRFADVGPGVFADPPPAPARGCPRCIPLQFSIISHSNLRSSHLDSMSCGVRKTDPTRR